LQRQSDTEEEETEPIQAKSPGALADSFEAGADVETQVSQSKGHGSPLPAAVRTYMEPRFGIDFSQVRVHTGSDALQMNQAVGAQAFTHGSDVYFGEGHNPANLELTAHELTHVVQQTGEVPLQTKKQKQPVAPLALRYLSNGVVLRAPKANTAFVGGEQGAGLQGPDDTKWVQPGQGGYARTMQGAATQFAGDFKELTDSARMKAVAPKLGKIDQAAAIAIHERNWYGNQKSGFAGPSTNKTWQDRYDYADKMATAYTEDKRQQQANFHSYNAFVPVANSVVQQISRVEAQKMMLGITDDAAMTTALVKGMDDARKVGHRAQRAFDKKKADESVKPPAATQSVEGAAMGARGAAADLDGKYLAFQGAVLIDQEAAQIKGKGKDAEERLAEINKVKDFLKSVGKAIDFAQSTIKSAPEKIANYVEKPSSILPDFEKMGEVIGDFVYYAEVREITSLLDTLNGMIEKKHLVKEFANVSAATKVYRASLMKFAEAGIGLQNALHDRRQDYLEMGLRLDRFAQDDPESRKEGQAPAHGGDRYATMMALVVELRQAVALAKFARDGMPPIEGGPDGKSKAQSWQVWANGVIQHRDSYASWHPNPTRFQMPEDEKAALEEVWGHLRDSDTICNEVIKRYGPVDAGAGKLMAALGGKKNV
jgi:hypothetical protein